MSQKDSKESMKLAVTLAATAAAGAASVGATAAATAGLAVVPTVFALVFEHAWSWKARDVERWWQSVVRGDGSKSTAELEKEIHAQREEPFVRETILRSVRALLDAVSAEAIEPLAVLSRQYIRHGKVPDGFFRGASRVLCELSSEEVGDLSHFARWLLNATDARRSVLSVYVSDDEQEAPDQWLKVPWRMSVDRDEFSPPVGTANLADAPYGERSHHLEGMQDPMRMVFLLRSEGLGRETTGVSFDAGPGTLVIDRETVARLAALFPDVAEEP